jgi:UDP-2,3-diacylglucosamine pyrophosphatase LpxH
MTKAEIPIQEDHLCVISDLHLGNPAFNNRDGFRSFVKHLSKNGINLCINGDGFDLLQSTAAKLAADLKLAAQSLKDFLSPGKTKLYYVNGNHDIHSESYLAKSGICSTRPFLNVISGDQRIHIEHGHRFDRRFRHFPRVYAALATALGKLLRVSPKFFHLYFAIEWWLYDLLKKDRGPATPMFDAPRHMAAALGLFARGFDIVILAHTHRHGLHIMEDGKILANAGAWTADTMPYLEIQRGSIRLKEWY